MKAKISTEIKKIGYTHGYSLLDNGKLQKTNESIVLIRISAPQNIQRLETFMQTFFSGTCSCIDFTRTFAA